MISISLLENWEAIRVHPPYDELCVLCRKHHGLCHVSAAIRRLSLEHTDNLKKLILLVVGRYEGHGGWSRLLLMLLVSDEEGAMLERIVNSLICRHRLCGGHSAYVKEFEMV